VLQRSLFPQSLGQPGCRRRPDQQGKIRTQRPESPALLARLASARQPKISRSSHRTAVSCASQTHEATPALRPACAGRLTFSGSDAGLRTAGP
jgi:hypothetical protein